MIRSLRSALSLALLLAGCAAATDERITIHYIPFRAKMWMAVKVITVSSNWLVTV